MQDKKLLFFVDPTWKRRGLYTPLLFPFWGNPIEESSLFAKQMYDSYPFDSSLYGITTNIEEADMVLAPYRHQWLLRNEPALLEVCAQTAQQANIPLLIDGVGDIEAPLTIPNAYILRIGGYRFLSEKGRIQIPPPSDDLLERCRNGVLSIRPKQEGIPTVGFAGWASLTPLQYVRTVLKELPWRLRGIFNSNYRAMTKGVIWRARAIAQLRRSPLVALNLKVRRSFSGSTKTAEGDMRVLREQLVETILNSDYALDVRGDANDSTRFFEILSLGRIPVLLDTERPLPFSDVIPYEEFCLIVDFRDLAHLPEKIAEFHESVSPERYSAMQQKGREAFVQYLRTDAQMRQIILLLEKTPRS